MPSEYFVKNGWLGSTYQGAYYFLQHCSQGVRCFFVRVRTGTCMQTRFLRRSTQIHIPILSRNHSFPQSRSLQNATWSAHIAT